MRLLVTTFVALFYGLTYLNEGKLDEAGVTVATVQNIMGAFHLLRCICRPASAASLDACGAPNHIVHLEGAPGHCLDAWLLTATFGLAPSLLQA